MYVPCLEQSEIGKYSLLLLLLLSGVYDLLVYI